VIFISALDEIQDKVQAFVAGGVDYVTKPFHFEEVLVRTETHLSLRRLQNQLREVNRQLLGANERMQRELTLAGKVQASFLASELPALSGWQLSAKLKPARQTSGDFYDLIELPEGRLGILVADVVDKGVAAALFMALSWILIRTYALEHPENPAPVLEAVNRRILAETDTGQFVTVFYGILDLTSGDLVYCNAGHPPPLLLNPKPRNRVQTLVRTGMALGVVETESWEQATIQINRGALLTLYSDGVTDATNEAGIPFGVERLESVLRGCLGRPAQEVQESLFAEIGAFVGQAISSDDITSVLVARELA
jgi:sigma-B regulation protein RsbU (phosphoserine phosphatase)